METSLSSRAIRFLESLPLFGIVCFVFLVTYPPFEVATEINLSIHMLQHVLIALSGVFISYPFYRLGKFDKIKSNRSGTLGFFVLASMIIFWHIPTYWDAAVVNPAIHVAEHFSFLIVGMMIGIFIPMLQDNFKMLVFILSLSGHMFYGFFLYLTPQAIYPVYPAGQQALLGLLLFAPSPIFFIGFLFFTLSRETRKLDREKMEMRGLPTKNMLSAVSRFSTAALSILMIALLVIYFGFTASAVYGAHVNASANAVVYIADTPYSWQYSPQNIIVVIGVNNTVVWVSHSFTQDTVTSVNGSFDSGPISPGQMWSHTFTTPGTFEYSCIYHPWMKGSVKVLSK
ncbi:MAG: DUF1404 family protein [Nitrososphaerales archaeon]